MDTQPGFTSTRNRDTLALLLLSAVPLCVWAVTRNGYGFHRDELQFLDDARHAAAGFVAYPPVTSLAARVSIAVFGIAPMWVRLPAVLMNMLTLVLGGLIARSLGGRRSAQLLSVALMLPAALAFSSVLQYNTPDMLAWTLLAFAVARVLATGDARWWLLAGAAVGLGVESKYTIAFPVAGLLFGMVVVPSARRYFRSPWFWAGAGVAVVVAAPNLIWLATHHFVTLRMEQHIHARDVRLGRGRGFFTDQLKFTLGAFPFAVAGLVSLLRRTRFRLLAFLWLGAVVLLAVSNARGYYLIAGYVPLYAAGAVSFARRTGQLDGGVRLGLWSAASVAVAATVALVAWSYLPLWPVQSRAWTWQMHSNEDMANEVGWPQYAAQVAAVRDALTPAERASYTVLADNFGEAGALALYGPQYHLPGPISPVNSFWYRGYGAPAETVIITGSSLEDEHSFHDCRIAARVTLPYGVRNEETEDEPEILVCHHLLISWPDAWAHNQRFG